MTRVLILEDEPAYLEELEHLLAAEGYEVAVATTARAAVANAIIRVPDVLVADWLLKTNLNGLDVARALGLMSGSLCTILITGFSSQDLRAEAETSELSDLLEKPFPGDRLRNAVRRACEAGPHQRAASPVGILCLDQQGGVTHTSERAIDLLEAADRAGTEALKVILEAAARGKEKKWLRVSPGGEIHWRMCLRRLPSGEALIAFLDEQHRSFARSPHLRILLDVSAPTERHWPLADHVLVVDSDEWERRRARILLRRSGCVVHTAEDPSTAVRLFEKDSQIDIVVLDAGLPVSRRRELEGALRDIRPRVALIAASEECPPAAPVAEETSRYLNKPWNVASLVRLIFSSSNGKDGASL